MIVQLLPSVSLLATTAHAIIPRPEDAPDGDSYVESKYQSDLSRLVSLNRPMLLDAVQTNVPGLGPFYSDLFKVMKYAFCEIVLKAEG
jgi:hypothetical protein